MKNTTSRKSDYEIFVPSRGNIDQLTISRLPKEVLHRVTLCIPEEHLVNTKSVLTKHDCLGVRVLVQPTNITTIQEKRKWMMTQVRSKFVLFMNDNLYLYVYCRKQDKHVVLHSAPEASKNFFTSILPELMTKYRSIGFGPKFFALKGGVKENYHLGYVFGFHTETAKEHVHIGRLPLYDDIDYTLQLLRKGISIGITYDLVVSPKIIASTRGVGSKERSTEVRDASAAALIKLHPEFVTMKENTSTSKNSEAFLAIVRVQWQKAAKSGGL